MAFFCIGRSIGRPLSPVWRIVAGLAAIRNFDKNLAANNAANIIYLKSIDIL
jgi:hypothetical protein